MSSPNRVDTSTLGWVRTEIEQTLGEARDALRRFVEDGEDVTPLRLFANNVHQVAGTLQMVELDGAAQLAQETESLAAAVVSGRLEDGDAAKDLLGDGLNHLSSYMERLARGLPDRPIDNVDVINALRRARRAEELDPYSLFHPDLEVYPSREEAAEELDADRYAERVRGLRRTYQVSLLKWLRGEDQDEAWRNMADTVADLFGLSRFQGSMQVWWVARAYLDVLKEAELTRDDSRKHPLAQLDQLMRKLVEDSEAAIAREGSEKLVRFMLYHIGRSEVHTDTARSVVRLFELDTLLGTGPEPPALPEAGVLAALDERCMESLRAVQAALDEYSRTGRADEAFQACEGRLEEIAGAARESGVDELAGLAAGVRDLLFGGDEPEQSEDALLAAARALLFIEQTLRHPEDIGFDWREEAAAAIDTLSGYPAADERPSLDIESQEVDTAALDAQELRRLVNAVAGQVEDNLKQAEQSLERFARDTADADSLTVVVDSLQQVHGAVRMLGQHKLCELLELALGQLRAIIAGGAYATDALLDALAVTIGTTDAYVRGLERDAPNIDALLGRAMQELEEAVAEDTAAVVDPASALKRIQDSFDAWIQDNADYEAFRILRRNLRDIGALAHERGASNLQRIAQEMTNLVDIVMDDPSFLSAEVEETLRRSLGTLSALTAPLESAVPAGDPADSAATVDEAPVVEPDAESDTDDDDLVRETFAEEAAECLQAIASGLGVLAADAGDSNTLTDVRRGFHTIKGSGRMARSRDIAELAWIVEDVLNRCLDGSLPLSPEILDFVDRARRELGGMLETGLDSSTDLQSWRDRAAALQRSDDPFLPEPEPVTIDIHAAAEEPEDAPLVGDWDGMADTEYAGETVALSGSSDTDDDAAAGALSLESLDGLGDRGHSLAGEPDQQEPASPFSDDEVITIFTKEALSHIAAIRAVIDECGRQGHAEVGKPLLRAVHTLQGNARSLHLVEMSEAYSALDHALGGKVNSGNPLQQSEMALLDELLISTAKVLDHLNRDKRFPEVVRQELAEIAERIEKSWGDPEATESGDTAEPGGLELVSELVAGDGEAGDTGHTGNVFEELTDTDRAAAGAADPAAGKPDSDSGSTVTAFPAQEVRTVVDDDLKDVFVEEATDILSRFESTLRHGKHSGVDEPLSNTLKRELHTLKGGARAAGLQAIGDLSHNAETMLESVAGSGDQPGDLLDVLEEVHDTLASMVQGLETGRTLDPDPGLIQRLVRGATPGTRDAGGPEMKAETGAALIPEEGAAAASSHEPAPPAGESDGYVPQKEPVEAGAPAVDESARAVGGRSTVRIHSNVLDKLVNYAGEVSISRSQIEEQLSGLKGNLNELRANVARFADQVRELDIQADTQIRSRVAEEKTSGPAHDFDPLELDRYSRLQQLSRSLSESVDDLVTIQTGLNRFATQTEGVLSQQAMMNSELQDGLMSARMVPFNTLVPRLRHQTRQTARELGKDVDFTVTGGELEVDRNILDQLGEALEHMIRNSLDHGIEPAEARADAGKPARGNLRIDCRQEGNEVLLRFSDDGAGLDVDRIKARAVEAGLLSVDSDLADDEVIQLIVLSGFSTARSVTQLSGRGVGLDVVNDAARRLGGSLMLENRPGEGVSFQLRLPLSLSITQAMFVRCGGQRFAIPLGVIETVLKTEPENLVDRSKDGDPLFKRDDRVYTLMDLTATLGLDSTASDQRVPILLVRMGVREVAVRVDELVGTDEIVVKQLGDHLGRMSGINGATITGDGSVVVILDLAELWLAQERLPAFRRELAQDVESPPRVLVVDDSLTVRKVTGRNLGRHGMEVSMARDGVDALDQLAKMKPDVMLVDIEMPRMDGYELMTRLREDVNYRDIPVIVITSRAGAKHREKAMELGASAYLTKPYQERDLLKEVNALLPGASQTIEH
ncbi:MAG: Hpt domain-containing protein [Gammaproteobacteria bacterium]|nr:Hpt domain-containing protein [Gammaproteobacteria bacterium]